MIHALIKHLLKWYSLEQNIHLPAIMNHSSNKLGYTPCHKRGGEEVLWEHLGETANPWEARGKSREVFQEEMVS